MSNETGRMLDTSCPVNWDWPGNHRLRAWWTGLGHPGWSGSRTLRDIVGLSGKTGGGSGTLVNSSQWIPGQNGFSGLSFTAASSQYVSATPATGVLPDLGAALTMEWVVTHSGVNNEHIFTLAKDDTGSANNAMGLVCSTEFSLNNWYVRTWSNAPLARIYPAPYNPALPSPIGVPVHLIFAVSAGQSNGFFWINGTPAQTIHDPRTGTESGNVGAVSFGRFNAAFPDPYYGGRLYHAAVHAERATNAFAAARYDQWRRGFPDAIRWLKSWSFGINVSGDGPATYSGVFAETIGPVTFSGNATHTKPTYSGVFSETIGPVAFAGSATHTKPTYSGVFAETVGATLFTGTATHTKPTYSGVFSETVGAATFAGVATHTVNTFSGVFSETVGVTTFSGTATHVKPTYSGVFAETIGPVAFSGSAVSAAAVFSGQLALTTSKATFSSNATFRARHTGVLAGTTGRVTFAGTATNANPSSDAYTGVLTLTTRAAQFNGAGSFYVPGTGLGKVFTSKIFSGNVFSGNIH